MSSFAKLKVLQAWGRKTVFLLLAWQGAQFGETESIEAFGVGIIRWIEEDRSVG